MFIYNVWDQIFHIDPKMSLVEGDLSILQIYKGIPTDTYLIIIIKYNRLNKTDHSWFMFLQLVEGKIYCELVIIQHRKRFIGREIEASSSLQNNFTRSILKIYHWIVMNSARGSYKFFRKSFNWRCNFPFVLILKLPCLTSAGYPRSSRFFNRIKFRDFW